MADSTVPVQLPVVDPADPEQVGRWMRAVEAGLAGAQDEIDSLLVATGVATTGEVPSNVPVATGITLTLEADASMSITLTWDYTQGARPADALLILVEIGTAALATPTVATAEVGFPVPVDATIYTFEGLPSDSNFRFGIAATRTIDGVANVGRVSSPASSPDWTDRGGTTSDFTGELNGTPAATVVTNAADGKTAFDDTTVFRSDAAPTNNPVPSAIAATLNADGSFDATLDFTYTQGANPATGFAFFFEDGSIPTEADPHFILTNVASPIRFILRGLPSATADGTAIAYFFAVAAFRNTSDGVKHLGTLVTSASSPDWQSISIGTPAFTGDIGNEPNAAVNEITNPSFEDDGYGWELNVGSGDAASVAYTSTSPQYGTKRAELNYTTVSADTTFLRTIDEITGAENKAIPVSAATLYQFAMWANRISGTGDTARLRIIQWASGGASVADTVLATNTTLATGVWTRLTGSLTTHASAAFISVRLQPRLVAFKLGLDGIQMQAGSTLNAFDDPFNGSKPASQIVLGSILNNTVATLGSNISLTVSTWTKILVVRVPISSDINTAIALIQGNMGGEVTNLTGTNEVTVYWRITRNGTILRTSGGSETNLGTNTRQDVPAFFHVDTAPTAKGIIHEYLLESKFERSSSNGDVEIQTPGSLNVQVFGN